jgi:hypothetical protein
MKYIVCCKSTLTGKITHGKPLPKNVAEDAAIAANKAHSPDLIHWVKPEPPTGDRDVHRK